MVRNSADSKTITSTDHKLPEDKTIGSLEVVATFDGSMPVGVTASHESRILALQPLPYPN